MDLSTPITSAGYIEGPEILEIEVTAHVCFGYPTGRADLSAKEALIVARMCDKAKNIAKKSCTKGSKLRLQWYDSEVKKGKSEEGRLHITTTVFMRLNIKDVHEDAVMAGDEARKRISQVLEWECRRVCTKDNKLRVISLDVTGNRKHGHGVVPMDVHLERTTTYGEVGKARALFNGYGLSEEERRAKAIALGYKHFHEFVFQRMTEPQEEPTVCIVAYHEVKDFAAHEQMVIDTYPRVARS